MKDRTCALLSGGGQDLEARNPAMAILYRAVDWMWLCGSPGKGLRLWVLWCHQDLQRTLWAFSSDVEVWKEEKIQGSCGQNKEDRRIFTGSVSSLCQGERMQMTGGQQSRIQWWIYSPHQGERMKMIRDHQPRMQWWITAWLNLNKDIFS